MSDDRVSVCALADELGVRKQRVFKAIARLGIRTLKSRDESRGNQLVATVSHHESAKLRGAIVREFPSAPEPVGNFYVIQLEPSLDPLRIKFGFTEDFTERLRKHRCSAPFCVPLKRWPSLPAWERSAIDCASAGLVQLHTEIYRADTLESVIARADSFFSVMPNLR